MTAQDRTWRPINVEEVEVVRSILAAADTADSAMIIEQLDGALVRPSTTWILDVKTSVSSKGSDLQDGPLPVRAYVPNSATYQGEIIVWLTAGRVSGLEYAWVSDHPPTRWPRPEDIEVVPD